MTKLKEFKVKDEDELLDSVILWAESDKEWYKGGEWVYPKGTKRIEKEISKDGRQLNLFALFLREGNEKCD